MIKIKNIDELNKTISKEKLPVILVNNVYADLLIMNEQLTNEYYNKEQVDLYGPLVLILTEEEFNKIEELVPSIEKNDYEYKEIVAVNHKYYINKVCYLFNNGNSGIIVYILRNFKDKTRFQDNIYITRNAKIKINEELLNFFIDMVKSSEGELKGKLDYLQVFDIKNIVENDVKILCVNHRQEEPLYSKKYYIPNLEIDDCKVFWISSEDENGNEYSTIMMAEDY